MEQSTGPKRVNLTLNEWDNFTHSMTLERGGREEAIRPRQTERGRICLRENAIVKGKENYHNMNKITWTRFFCSMALCLPRQSLLYHYIIHVLSAELCFHRVICCSQELYYQCRSPRGLILHYVGDTGVSPDLYRSNHIKITHFIGNT